MDLERGRQTVKLEGLKAAMALRTMALRREEIGKTMQKMGDAGRALLSPSGETKWLLGGRRAQLQLGN